MERRGLYLRIEIAQQQHGHCGGTDDDHERQDRAHLAHALAHSAKEARTARIELCTDFARHRQDVEREHQARKIHVPGVRRDRNDEVKDQAEDQTDCEIALPVQRDQRDRLDDERRPDRQVLADDAVAESESAGERRVQRDGAAHARVEKVRVDLVEDAVEVHHSEQGPTDDPHALMQHLANRLAVTDRDIRLNRDDQYARIHEGADHLVIGGDRHVHRIPGQHQRRDRQQQ